jgi:Uma2 family endonuclease
MGTTAGLVTVAEFERMPNPKNGSRLELHHGEVVEVPPAKPDHAEIQDRITDALRAIASADWKIRAEFTFRPKPEHEIWEADVGVMRRDRWEQALGGNQYPLGAPEMVVEVLSPSNTASEMYDRERMCLDAGCREFWVVDPKTWQIRVSTADRVWQTYGAGDQVPVSLFGGSIALDEIFAR